MKKIRLGNDIQIIWSVRGAQWLDVEELDVSLLNKLDEEVQFIPSIEVDETTNVCTISGTFAGRNQKLTGTYRLLLQMNNGKADMLTLDHIEVFQLVDVCSFGIVEGLDSDNLTTATVEVSDIVSTIVGNTDLSSFVTRAEFEAGLATKQGTLTWDEAPTEDSDNAISSGAVYEALSGIKTLEVWDVGTLSTPSFTGHTWADLQALVMGESTTLLLRGEESHGYDLYFSIAGIVYQGETLLETTFIGQKADKSQLILTLTNTNGNISCTPTNVINVNNSNFSTFGYTKAQIDTLLLNKMDDIDIDSSPSSGSLHLVTSGGIYSALQGKLSDAPTDNKQYARKNGTWTEVQASSITVDPAPTQGSTNAVQSGGVYDALQNVHVTVDPTPTMASPNPVSSGGVYTALQGVGGGNMQIVTEGSATTISPIADKYYVLTYDVGTLIVNLPNLAAESSIKGFVLFFHVGTYQSITINPASSGQNVYYYDGFEFADNTTYEMNFVWNGAGWIVAYGIVSGYANS